MCKYKTCNRQDHSQGYCSAHLNRSKRGTDMNAPIQERTMLTPNICTYEGCEKKYVAKGYCNAHYKRAQEGRLLSTPVRITNRPKVIKKCPACKETFSVRVNFAYQVCCSRKCAQSLKCGENNQHWKGGKTSENAEQRNRFAREMRDNIFARDNYTCQICQTAASGNLQVDHIQRWSDFPELRFDPNNCRTLCRPCHYYVTLKRKMPEGSMWGVKTSLIKDLS